MARPKKNNCDYFSHDNDMRNNIKVKAIRQKFVNGYAIWSMLLEYLTGCNGNRFIDNETEFELLAGDFGFSSEEIESVVRYALKLEMLTVENGYILSESLNERLKPVYEKRATMKVNMPQKRHEDGSFRSSNATDGGVSVAEMPQSKVNKSKLNKTKVNDEGKNPPPLSIYKSDHLFKIPELKKKYLGDEILVAAATKSLSLPSEKDVAALMDRFETHLGTEKITEKTESDFRKHFLNWSRKQKPESSAGRSTFDEAKAAGSRYKEKRLREISASTGLKTGTQ